MWVFDTNVLGFDEIDLMVSPSSIICVFRLIFRSFACDLVRGSRMLPRPLIRSPTAAGRARVSVVLSALSEAHQLPVYGVECKDSKGWRAREW